MIEITTEERVTKIKEEYLDFIDKVLRIAKTLSSNATCLNELALEERLSPAFGRDKEITLINQTLLRRNKRNIILVGKAGCGKSSIVEQLALSYKEELFTNANSVDISKIPLIFDLPLGSLVGGTKYRGEFEERCKNIIDEISHIQKRGIHIILFIDEIHNFINCGNQEGSISAAELFKPCLAKGNVSIIGATTPEEIKILEVDKALMRRFQRIDISEFSGEQAVKCLDSILMDYKNYFNINLIDVSPQDLYTKIQLSEHGVFPDNVIDVIDITMAEAKYNKKDSITMSDMSKTLSRLSRKLFI